MSRAKIKVCGVKTLNDCLAIIKGDADFIGFQFIPFAKRYIPLTKAVKIIKKLPKKVKLVGVFVNESPKKVNFIASKCNLSYVQLHGKESPEYCRLIKTPIIKAFEVMGHLDLDIFEPYKNIVDKFLLDTPHIPKRRPGQTFDFEIAKEACKKYDIMIAGGLNADNIGKAIKLLHPWGVDVSGSVRENSGISQQKVKEFVKSIKKAEK